MDDLQQKKRSLVVAIDFKAAFDKVWRGGLLQDLAAYGMNNRFLQWLREWLSDRRGFVRWNTSCSRSRIFSQGLPQGSPLSPLLYCIATASLPPYIKAKAPNVEVNQFADDLTVQSAAENPASAAIELQRALDAITDWSGSNYVQLAAEKTVALTVSVDPRETAGKALPNLVLNGQPVGYEKKTSILGVTQDTQLRFSEHAKTARKKFLQRLNILKSLSGKDWGLRSVDLRHVCRSYVKSGAMYAYEVWGMCLSKSQIDSLETCNTMAGRLILGAPKGSPSVPVLTEAGLSRLHDDGIDQAAKLLDNCRRFPPGHPLKHLINRRPRQRLKSRESGLRTDWRTTALQRIAEIPDSTDPREALNLDKEERKRRRYMEEVSEQHIHRTISEGSSLAIAPERTRAEEVALYQLRLNRHPALASTACRHGKQESAKCTKCDMNEDENTTHFLITCPHWTNERLATLGHNPSLRCLQETPEDVLKFLLLWAFWPPQLK